jgi:hypothetical protein
MASNATGQHKKSNTSHNKNFVMFHPVNHNKPTGKSQKTETILKGSFLPVAGDVIDHLGGETAGYSSSGAGSRHDG